MIAPKPPQESGTLEEMAGDWMVAEQKYDSRVIFNVQSHARLVILLRRVREEALEEGAEYVSTHCPVFRSGQGAQQGWHMVKEVEGGRVQEQYALALRALAKEKPKERTR